MPLKKYASKRNFNKTPEPKPKKKKSGQELTFTIQKHHASHLHYDFRLEMNGVLKSWAVPKGPSLDPDHKRLAVEVEDHPLDYGRFEGKIPAGEYGAGTVILWDYGIWRPDLNVKTALKKGRLDFELHGLKLQGRWSLIRMGPSGVKNNWLLVKRHDAWARTGYDITVEQPDSVTTKLTQISKKKILLPRHRSSSGPSSHA